MKPPNRLENAMRRLSAALDLLDAAFDRRADADLLRANLAEELAVMQDDRSRLAVELDGVLARARSLEHANGEVARRLERASSTIRAVLGDGDAEPRA